MKNNNLILSLAAALLLAASPAKAQTNEVQLADLHKAHKHRLGGCWIGANVVVLPGVTIGDGTVIGAGSVVTKDIPANVVAVGNPCRVIKRINNQMRN